jgi:hypothetical protein
MSSSSYRHIDLHDHATWQSPVHAEGAEDDRLHRHIIRVAGTVRGYTTWAYNTRNHAHRLPDGAWTRPRRDLTVSRTAPPTRSDAADLAPQPAAG